MQKASNLYKDSIKQSVRNRGYIRATIGIVNSDAQNNIESSDQNKLAYFSNTIKPFKGYSVEKPYATAEENYSKIDGTMYFLPEKDKWRCIIHNNKFSYFRVQSGKGFL